MAVLFLLPYPLGKAPSQRFRVEALLPVLDGAGISYTLRPFMTEATWNVLYKGGSLPQKGLGILKGYLGRLKTVLFEARRYDRIFIHREAAPLGPPVFEWYLKKVLGKKIVYDFDDAIWIPNTSAQNRLASGLKAFWKVGTVCRWSHAISAGNDYLCAYAAQHTGGKVVHVPTVVDTGHRYDRLKRHTDDRPLIVGWTGSHSTLKYLDEIVPAVAALQEEIDFEFLVIADKSPQLPLKNWRFVPWNATTEIEDLLQIDIGVMPLTPDPWSEGKCGFKLIQYLALGIPALASPVGVNRVIVEEGRNGFLYETPEQFRTGLRTLLGNAARRAEMGEAGRRKMVAEYSIAAISARFIELMGATDRR